MLVPRASLNIPRKLAVAVDDERVRLWMFARLAAEPRDDWTELSLALARRLA